LVQQTFIASDANIILRIPIFEHEEDHLAWHYDEKGIFFLLNLLITFSLCQLAMIGRQVLLMVYEVVCGERAFGAGFGD
jgi:hypothetical protein